MILIEVRPVSHTFGSADTYNSVYLNQRLLAIHIFMHKYAATTSVKEKS